MVQEQIHSLTTLLGNAAHFSSRLLSLLLIPCSISRSLRMVLSCAICKRTVTQNQTLWDSQPATMTRNK